MTLMESFITTMENVESCIDYTIISDSEANVKPNRKFLSSVIRALEYFGHLSSSSNPFPICFSFCSILLL